MGRRYLVLFTLTSHALRTRDIATYIPSMAEHRLQYWFNLKTLTIYALARLFYIFEYVVEGLQPPSPIIARNNQSI